MALCCTTAMLAVLMRRCLTQKLRLPSACRYPRNCLSKTCSAYCNMGCHSGHKQSSEVWLRDAVRAGAHVLTGVHAQEVTTQSCQVREATPVVANILS
jgi:hypothetical protein